MRDKQEVEVVDFLLQVKASMVSKIIKDMYYMYNEYNVISRLQEMGTSFSSVYIQKCRCAWAGTDDGFPWTFHVLGS